MSYSQMVQSLRETFLSGVTRDVSFRKRQLRALMRLVDENTERLCQEMKKDLGKPRIESIVMEIDMIRNDIIVMLEGIDGWIGPRKVEKTIATMFDSPLVKREPYGVCLILGAWNYPAQLALLPLVGAIAGGNCAVLKPSEVSANTAALIGELVPKYLDTSAYQVVQGGIPETTGLLQEKFDHIFYTGSSNVGKIVMAAAAKHLTPVVLELGGKSPVWVDGECDLSVAANRICWGKLCNAGQTCIAPDYVMCERAVQGPLVAALKQSLAAFYGDSPEASQDLARIVSDRRFQTLKKLLEATQGSVEAGGAAQADPAQKYIPPTLVSNVTPEDSLMSEEIFGPILPIMPVENVDEAIKFINSRDKPLSLYIYTTNTSVQNKIIERTDSGSVCVNDCLMQISIPSLPFGGVGTSGFGAYHGKFSFDAYTHPRGILVKDLRLESLNALRYPPYTENKLTWTRRLTRRTERWCSPACRTLLLASLVAALAAALALACKVI